MCEREQAGLLIAAVCKIEKKGPVWLVPSQNGEGKYTVVPDKSEPYCSCHDHTLNGQKCKHLFAVEFVRQREDSDTAPDVLPIAEVSRKPTYTQDWRAYNKAQTNEKHDFQRLLRSLCDQIKEPAEARPGRPRLPLSDLLFSACFKVYAAVSARRFMCDLSDAADKGYLEKSPHFNSLLAAFDSEELTPLLHRLITAAAIPLKGVESDFAIDSSGFTSSRFVKWVDHKYGKVRQEHDWVKAHVVCGVKTNVITAVEIHDRNTNDSPILPSLLESTVANFRVSRLCADKQYASRDNFNACDENGVEAFIGFRDGTTGASGGAFGKAYHLFALHREEFLKHYHKRSNVESTFMMIKTKFGDSVRSKTQTAMKNEVLCKILAHNVCCLISAVYELGIEPNLLAA